MQPFIGRGFLPEDDAVAGREPVVVISHALWQRRFAGDAAVLGRQIWVNGSELTVIGVAPPDFTGTLAGLAFDLWTPVTMHPALSTSSWALTDRGTRWLRVFGRLAPDGSLAAAGSEAQTIGARLTETYAEAQDRGLAARTLDVGPTEQLATLFAVMLGITLLVLVIVCTNVANLLLLRGAARQHELAVRLALGARPSRIVRQLMTESLVLAIAGVVLGLGIAAWGQGTIDVALPDTPLPVAIETGLNGRVVLVLTLIGVSTVFLFGLTPAVRAARNAGRVSLAGGARGATAAGARLRGALVGAQFALSVAVLVPAGLFLRRLDELKQVDRGFRDPHNVVIATLDFEIARVRGDSARQQLVERVVERLRAIPSVRAAAAATFVPLGFLGYYPVDIYVDGYVPRRGEAMSFLANRVSAGYFETMGIPIVRGRPIEARDREGGLPAAVVNEAFARRFWGAADPVSRRIRVEGRELTVVGVAANGKYEFTAPLDDPSPPFVYLPLAQWSANSAVLHVRATGDPLALLPAIRREVAAVEPALAVLSPTTLESYSSIPFFPLRLGGSVLTALGGAALALAALGLYAVIGYAVSQRQREIGVRMALGATPRLLMVGVLAEAVRYAGIGALAGIVLAWLVTSMLPSYVVPQGASASVVPTALALAALAAVTLLAALVPARRATHVNPATSLRAE